jgi:hypothetical protein
VISACGFHARNSRWITGLKSSGAKATVTPRKPQADAIACAVAVLVVTNTCKSARPANRSSNTHRAEANSPFDAACNQIV